MFGSKKLKWMAFFTALFFMLTVNPSVAATDENEGWYDTPWKVLKYAGVAGGAVGAVAAAPAVLGAAGFASAGIAAGSLAAKMFSATAIANGGAVPAASISKLKMSSNMKMTGSKKIKWISAYIAVYTLLIIKASSVAADKEGSAGHEKKWKIDTCQLSKLGVAAAAGAAAVAAAPALLGAGLGMATTGAIGTASAYLASSLLSCDDGGSDSVKFEDATNKPHSDKPHSDKPHSDKFDIDELCRLWEVLTGVNQGDDLQTAGRAGKTNGQESPKFAGFTKDEINQLCSTRKKLEGQFKGNK